MKLIDVRDSGKYFFLGGAVSPSTLFDEDHVLWYMAKGYEIVQVHFDSENAAREAYERVVDLLALDAPKEVLLPRERALGERVEPVLVCTKYIVKLEGQDLYITPRYIDPDPYENKKRNYKIPYRIIKELRREYDVHYNDETGELIIDTPDEKFVVDLIRFKTNKVEPIYDAEHDLVAVPVDYTPKNKG